METRDELTMQSDEYDEKIWHNVLMEICHEHTPKRVGNVVRVCRECGEEFPCKTLQFTHKMLSGNGETVLE
jgi:ribosomal protein L37AE/L43A